MKKLVFIILCVVVASCGDSNPAPKPQHLLNEGDMVNILYDISLMQAIKSFTPQSLEDHNVNSRTYIYKKYKIDSTTFAQNHLYYASNLEEYEKIQKKVADLIKKNREKFATKKPAATAKPATTNTVNGIVPPAASSSEEERKARMNAIRSLRKGRKVPLNKASVQ